MASDVGLLAAGQAATESEGSGPSRGGGGGGGRASRRETKRRTPAAPTTKAAVLEVSAAASSSMAPMGFRLSGAVGPKAKAGWPDWLELPPSQPRGRPGLAASHAGWAQLITHASSP